MRKVRASTLSCGITPTWLRLPTSAKADGGEDRRLLHTVEREVQREDVHTRLTEDAELSALDVPLD